MTRFLFCGGSHLAKAKPALMDFVAEAYPGAETRFAVTAAPQNRHWAMGGGRYEVEGTRVRRSGGRTPLDLDLADFDVVVFAGQWIMPDRLFGASFDWSQPMSDTLLDEVFRQNIERPCQMTPKGSVCFENEPLTLFSSLAPGRVILAADPPPRNATYRKAPVAVKRQFYSYLRDFCAEHRIRLLPLPEAALAEDLSLHDALYMKESDDTHASPDYWKMVVRGGLGEAVAAVLNERETAPASE